MKKTIPFKKQLTFKTNINEITSISLENTLHNSAKTVEGDLIVSGTYKITETSIQVDEFEYTIPINIEINDKYDSENMTIDIDDFYYEIINNNILEVNIEILLDNIIEKKVVETPKPEIIESEVRKMETIQETPGQRCIEEETELEQITSDDKQEQPMNNIFDNFETNKEEYSTYYVYIVREGDSIDTIIAKYNVNKENLEEYNNLTELKLGDKIIIPETKNAGN